MTDQTKITFTVSKDLDKLLDLAFKRAVSDGNEFPTRTDYIRHILGDRVIEDLKDYSKSQSPLVIDDILNKVIWTILVKQHIHELNEITFHALHLNEFVSKSRIKVEEIFRYLADHGCARIYQDENQHPTLDKFDFDLVKKLALNNIKQTREISLFVTTISKWNTPQASCIDDMCFTCFGNLPANVKPILSENGFIITPVSKWQGNDLVKSFLCNSPSDYARQLWDIPIFKNNEKKNSLYVTLPDIYIGQDRKF